MAEITAVADRYERHNYMRVVSDPILPADSFTLLSMPEELPNVFLGVIPCDATGEAVVGSGSTGTFTVSVRPITHLGEEAPVNPTFDLANPVQVDFLANCERIFVRPNSVSLAGGATHYKVVIALNSQGA